MGSQSLNNAAVSWVASTWDEYVAKRNPGQTERYSPKKWIASEPADVGAEHGSDLVLMVAALSLFAATRGISLSGRSACRYHKAGQQDCQPDLSYYVGLNATAIPAQTDIVDLDRFPPPDLVIEVGKHSLLADQGPKRLLYEDLNVREYWIVDVANTELLAFAIANQGSRRIRESQIFPRLPLTILERALLLSRRRVQSEVITWLLKQFQEN